MQVTPYFFCSMPYGSIITIGPALMARIRLFSESSRARNFSYQEELEPTDGESPDPLVRSSIFETSDPEGFTLPGGYGKEGRSSVFSRLARRSLLDAGAVMDRDCPRDECLFITCTHPGSTGESFRALAEWSGYVVHRFKAWVARYCPSNYSFYCWEWQKRGALHLHYVIHCPDPLAFRFLQRNVKAEWVRLVDSVCLRSGIDLWGKADGGSWAAYKSVVRVEAARVKKAVAAYLSKYLSKGGDQSGDSSSHRFFPSRWYGISRALRERVKELTYTAEGRAYQTYRAARLFFDDWLTRLEPVASVKRYYSLGSTTGKLAILLLDRVCGEKVLCELLKGRTMLSSDQAGEFAAYRRVILAGLACMEKNRLSQSLFLDFSSPYARSVLDRLSSSESVSMGDMELLLDSLAYSLRRAAKSSRAVDLPTTSFLREATRLIPAGKYWPLWSSLPDGPKSSTCIPSQSETIAPLGTPLSRILPDRVSQDEYLQGVLSLDGKFS